MDNRRVLKSHRQRSYGKVLPSPVRGGLLSKVKRYLSGSALDFVSPPNKRLAPSRPLANASIIRKVSLAPELLLTPVNNSMIDPDHSTNRVLSSFFHEKGDQPLSAIEYEGVMSLLEKSKAEITLQHPDDSSADNFGGDKHNNSSLAPFTQRILRNTSMVDPNISSSTAPDFEPVYHTFSETSRANTSMKRVYQFSGLPSPYKTRIRVPNVAARKIRRVTGLLESQVLPKLVPGEFKPRSATANSLLTVLSGNLDQKEDPRPLYNSYSRTKRNAQMNSDGLSSKEKIENMGASDIAKTISHSSMSESALKSKKNSGFGLDFISDQDATTGTQQTDFKGKSLFDRIGIPEQSGAEAPEQSIDADEGAVSKFTAVTNSSSSASSQRATFSLSTRDQHDRASKKIPEGESKELEPFASGAHVQSVNDPISALKDSSQQSSVGSALSKAGSNTVPSTFFESTKSETSQISEPSSTFGNKPMPAFSFGTAAQSQNLTFGSKVDPNTSPDILGPQTAPKPAAVASSSTKFSFGSTNATIPSDVPEFSFGSAQLAQGKSTSEAPIASSQQAIAISAPAFTFGASKSAEMDSAPKFSFNASQPSQEGPVTNFLFGSSLGKKAELSKSFSFEPEGKSKPVFGASSELTTELKTPAVSQPTFNFGKNTAEKSAELKQNSHPEPAPSGFAFGQFKPATKSEVNAEKPKLPMFNFGAKAAENVSTESPVNALPAFGGSPFQFGGHASKEEITETSKIELKTPLFQFGAKPKADNFSGMSTTAAAKPSPFSFSSTTKSDASQPSQFGSVRNSADSKTPAFSSLNEVPGDSGKESSGSELKPKVIFSSVAPGFTFGKSSSGVSGATNAPAFSFSASLNDTPSSLNTNSNGGSKSKPGFSFGSKGDQGSEVDANANKFVFPEPIFTEGKADENEAKKYQSLFPFE